MLRALTDAAVGRPRAMLALAVGGLVAAGLLAAGTVGRLGLGPAEALRSESERVADRLTAELGHEATPAIVVVVTGTRSVDSPVSRVALDVLSSRLRATPDVVAVERGPTSEDERTTALFAYLRDDDPGEYRRALARFRDGLDPGGLDVAIGGQAAVLEEARRGVWGELVQLALLAVPAVAVVLLLAFGARLVAAPALSAGTGLLGAAGVLGAIGELGSVSALGIAAAAVVATIVGIEACLALVSRYRREAAAIGGGVDALRHTMASAGRAVILGAAAAAAVGACAVSLPVLDARSVALGAALAAPLALLAALVVTPSLVVISEVAEPMRMTPGPPGNGSVGAWQRLQSALLRRRVVACVVVLVPAAGLLALAAAGRGAETVPFDAAGLPDESEARRAEVGAASGLGSATIAPVAISTEDDRDRQERRRLAGLPGVADVDRPPIGDSPPLLVAGTDANAGSLGARDAVESLRAAGVEVGGRDAEALDVDRALWRWLPVASGIAVVALAAVTFAALVGWSSVARRAACSILLAVGSLLPAAAATGVLELVFGAGRLTGLLDYESRGGPSLVAVIAGLVAVGAVSALRTASVAGLVVVRAPGVSASPSLAATSAGAVKPMVTATAVVVLGGAALLSSDVAAAKQFGLVVATGVVLDLVLVRALLAPGVMRLTQ